ncbi:hypothetical protein [Duganella sp. OV510]|nr:hypothetical protein [Duganella sp. OV510]
MTFVTCRVLNSVGMLARDEAMRDLLGVFALAVVAPLVMLALCTSVVMFVRSVWSGRRPNYWKVLKAVGIALVVALLFPLLFTFTIGLLFARELGYGYAIVVLLSTAVATLGSYAYVVVRDKKNPARRPDFREAGR